MEIPKVDIYDKDFTFPELLVEHIQSVAYSSDLTFAVVFKRRIEDRTLSYLSNLRKDKVFSKPIFLGEDI